MQKDSTLLTQIVGAFVIVWIVPQMKREFWRDVVVVTAIGFLVGLLDLIPAWNWWHFPFGYVAVGCLDLIVGWFLGGLIIARVMSGGALKRS